MYATIFKIIYVDRKGYAPQCFQQDNGKNIFNQDMPSGKASYLSVSDNQSFNTNNNTTRKEQRKSTNYCHLPKETKTS